MNCLVAGCRQVHITTGASSKTSEILLDELKGVTPVTAIHISISHNSQMILSNLILQGLASN